MPQDDLIVYLEGIGFENATIVLQPNEVTLTPDQYFRKKGPLDDDWRRMDSIWTNADIENETVEAKKFLQQMFDNNSFDKWFNEVERKRKVIGNTTSLFVQNPDN